MLVYRETTKPQTFQFWNGETWRNSCANYRVNPTSFTSITRDQARKLKPQAFR